jgi:stage III sporulation protein AA
MDEIKYHLSLFPPRLKCILERFSAWEKIYEIRLRAEAPLSLTCHKGNLTVDENGKPCPLSRAVRCAEEELSYLLGAFCKGSVYRYFDRLQDGVAVDDYGWRLGVCTKVCEGAAFLPQRISGINLRIPRHVPLAATPIIEKIKKEGLFSLLIFSPPGEGKTTILRSLAALLSSGWRGLSPLRVAAIDRSGELFPKQMQTEAGLLDVLSDYEKNEGIELATRLLSPQIILCDEVGSSAEAEAILASCSGGCYVVATAHASSKDEARHTPYLAKLMDSGKFHYGLFLKKESGEQYRCRFSWESFL